MPSTRSRSRPAASPALAERVRLEALATGLNSAATHLLRRIRRSDAAMGVTPSKASALSVLVFGGACSLGSLAAAPPGQATSMRRTRGTAPAGRGRAAAAPAGGRGPRSAGAGGAGGGGGAGGQAARRPVVSLRLSTRT